MTGKNDLDRALADLPADLRWREWLHRVEAVLFASAVPVARDDLARVVGQGVSVDLLISDLAADLAPRPYEVVQVAGGWMLRTKPAYAEAIRVAADVAGQGLGLSAADLGVLAAIAYHQPISRDGLRGLFGGEVSREVILRLSGVDLITTGPREPRRGAPHTYVTTPAFLVAFGLNTLRDLANPEHLADAGLHSPQGDPKHSPEGGLEDGGPSQP